MTRNDLALLVALLLAPLQSTAQEPGAAMVDGRGVILRGLDKMNSKVAEFTVRVGETVTFERLEVKVDACLYNEGDIEGEAVALLEIRDVREAEPRFKGWMFGSSPGLSALDHPRYDVWVINCTNS